MRYAPALALFLASQTALADPPVIQTIPEGEDRITPLKQGQAAPYSGQLYDAATSLRWANWLTQQRVALRIEADYHDQLRKAADQAWREKLTAAETRYLTVTRLDQATIAGLQGTVIKLENPPFYQTVWFGVAMGVAVTGLGVLAVAAAVK
jgi:hypothetical protein